METESKTKITVQAIINAPIEKVWHAWIKPEHITNWNFASDDWHAPSATNDFHEGGNFSFRMEAKDGSFGFDFEGKYDEIFQGKYIAYTIADGRKVSVSFFEEDQQMTKVVEVFEPESQNPVEMQQAGWQMILDNFKKYVENL